MSYDDPGRHEPARDDKKPPIAAYLSEVTNPNEQNIRTG